MLIEKCQEISAAQCIRISFLSGDVHVCAAGRLYSNPKVPPTFPSLHCPDTHMYLPQSLTIQLALHTQCASAR